MGFNYSTRLLSSRQNMSSARAHQPVIMDYITAELASGRMLGPFAPWLIPKIHMNRMGVVLKGPAQKKWRLITDYSHPPGSSVNDGITQGLCSLKYTSVETVAAAAWRLGAGTLLMKLDIKSAYGLHPVHPMDRPLLGVQWGGTYYVDKALPFGLRSAPKVFMAIADALQWVMENGGVLAVDHYLDDFLKMGQTRTNAG